MLGVPLLLPPFFRSMLFLFPLRRVKLDRLAEPDTTATWTLASALIRAAWFGFVGAALPFAWVSLAVGYGQLQQVWTTWGPIPCLVVLATWVGLLVLGTELIAISRGWRRAGAIALALGLPLLVVPPIAVLSTMDQFDPAGAWSAPARAWTEMQPAGRELRLLLFCSMIPFAFLVLVRAAPGSRPTWGLPAGTWLASYAATLAWDDFMGSPYLYSDRGQPVLLGVPILALAGLEWGEGRAREIVRPRMRAIFLGPRGDRGRRIPIAAWVVCLAGALLMGAVVLPFHLILRQRVRLAAGRAEGAAYLFVKAPSLVEPGLLRLLSSSNPEDRSGALQVLSGSYQFESQAQANYEPFLSRVIELLRSDPDRHVRALAVLGFLDSFEPAARTAVAFAVDDPDPLVRALARVSRLLENEEPATQDAIDALTAVEDPGERRVVLFELYRGIVNRRRPSPEPTDPVVVLLAATSAGAPEMLAEWTNGLAVTGNLPAAASTHSLLTGR